MKSKIKIWQLVIAVITIPIFMGNCTNDSYLIDGGKSNPYYDGTIMEFLQSRSPKDDPKNDYFSDLIEIIRLANMEEVLEEENVTFFAPTNWSIRKSVALLNKMWYQMGNDSIKNLLYGENIYLCIYLKINIRLKIFLKLIQLRLLLIRDRHSLRMVDCQ